MTLLLLYDIYVADRDWTHVVFLVLFFGDPAAQTRPQVPNGQRPCSFWISGAAHSLLASLEMDFDCPEAHQVRLNILAHLQIYGKVPVLIHTLLMK